MFCITTQHPLTVIIKALLVSVLYTAGNEKVRYMEFCGQVRLKLLTPDLTLEPSYPPCEKENFPPLIYCSFIERRQARVESIIH